MANTWTTLLDVIYPTGSLYFSTNSTSPASKFGGTWTRIQDAFIAAKGSGYITGTVAAYSGDKYMKLAQMPVHDHYLVLSADNAYPEVMDGAWNTVPRYEWTSTMVKSMRELVAYIYEDSSRQDASYWINRQLTEKEYDLFNSFSNPRNTIIKAGGGQTSLLTTILHIFGDVPPSGAPLLKKEGAELPKSHCSEGSDE